MWNIFRKKAEKKIGKVVVFGCASSVGQPLSMLLKLSPHVKELVCCNTPLDTNVPSVGVAADLAHIDTNAKVKYAYDINDWPAALHSAQLVLICGGSDFDPQREFNAAAFAKTAPIMEPIIDAIAASAPTAVIGVVSSPVNALVPLCAEYMKAHGKFDPRKLFGITTLDCVRTRRLIAECLGMNPFDITIPVVGGRGGVTACPLISQTRLRVDMENIIRICMQVQQYGAPLDDAGANASDKSLTKDPLFSSSIGRLGSAYAAHEFIMSVLKAQRGDYGITECALIESTIRPETPFFSSRVRLGPEGVEQIFHLGPMNDFERELVDTAAKEVAKDVDLAYAFLKQKRQ